MNKQIWNMRDNLNKCIGSNEAGAKKGMFPRSQDRVLQCPNQGPRVGAPEEVLGGEDDKRQRDL